MSRRQVPERDGPATPVPAAGRDTARAVLVLTHLEHGYIK
jgi:hypothetical protein